MDKLGPYELNQIVTGDARELAEGIPDNSIDLIFTDPVYWQIEDYEWLAKTAQRVLVLNGSVIAQCGEHHRYNAETAMRGQGLIPRPLIAEIMSGGMTQLLVHKACIGWKAYIWFTKGAAQRYGEWIVNRYLGVGADKNHHSWGDNTGAYLNYIEKLCPLNGVVFDPFTGGGTVPAVCKMLGRDYLAFEIDPATAEKARERVFNTQPPLFVPEPVQMELIN